MRGQRGAQPPLYCSGQAEDGSRNFVSLAVLLVQTLGFVVPLGVLAGVGWLGVRRLGHHPAS